MTRLPPAAVAVAAALATALAASVHAQPPAAASRRALLIGVDRYLSNDMNTLKGAANDARRMRGVLVGRFEFPADNVRVLLDEEATRVAILDAIRAAFPCQRLRVADRGLREGMLVEMMRADGVWDRAVA